VSDRIFFYQQLKICAVGCDSLVTNGSDPHFKGRSRQLVLLSLHMRRHIERSQGNAAKCSDSFLSNDLV